MTQLIEREVLAITVNDTPYTVHPIERTPQSIATAAVAHSLVIAQRVDEAGNPARRPEPGKWREDMSPTEWEAYIKRRKALHDSGQAPPTVAVEPYLGTVRCLGANAAYFALDYYNSSITAHIPFYDIPATNTSPVSSFRLYEVE